ncbi:hypothetical protein GGTG_01352 [Gaeumannomyces tritici R3-111a-1]|uniref:Uncharacterized protein n=1 Tax=Gaeumannomyces tritici (strain R3-111a-1) TaxID=644352 RepID=J3NJC0_GAET3|nr:hypothetical protein GGTG_01352 [Gaeumannomyces tritici R3-111a-1]EJT81371.1 hypothetical protein GGTG_01352 [Gaeumannomyces tritici R3-111a-1]
MFGRLGSFWDGTLRLCTAGARCRGGMCAHHVDGCGRESGKEEEEEEEEGEELESEAGMTQTGGMSIVLLEAGRRVGVSGSVETPKTSQPEGARPRTEN